jgi:hypothetical protein
MDFLFLTHYGPEVDSMSASNLLGGKGQQVHMAGLTISEPTVWKTSKAQHLTTYGSPELVTGKTQIQQFALVHNVHFKADSYNLPGMKYLHNTQYESESKWQSHLRMEVQ